MAQQAMLQAMLPPPPHTTYPGHCIQAALQPTTHPGHCIQAALEGAALLRHEQKVAGVEWDLTAGPAEGEAAAAACVRVCVRDCLCVTV